MHVKRESELPRTRTEVRTSPSEVVFDPEHPLVSLNPRSNQFHHEIMSSMAKVRTRMGGTLAGNDEESRRFVQNIADMHDRAYDARRSGKGSNDGDLLATPRVHYSVVSINDFIDKLRFISLTKRALSSNEPN